MPVPINIAANLALGASLVLILRKSEAIRQRLVSWYFLFLLLFLALLFTPVATYLFRFYPQWSMLYWFDPQLLPELDRWFGLLSLLAILLNFGAALLGFVVTRLGVITNRTWLWAAPAVVAGLVGLGFLGPCWERVLFIGDYDTFWQGHARLLFATIPGWVIIALYASMVAFVWIVARRFRHHDPTIF